MQVAALLRTCTRADPTQVFLRLPLHPLLLPSGFSGLCVLFPLMCQACPCFPMYLPTLFPLPLQRTVLLRHLFSGPSLTPLIPFLASPFSIVCLLVCLLFVPKAAGIWGQGDDLFSLSLQHLKQCLVQILSICLKSKLNESCAFYKAIVMQIQPKGHFVLFPIRFLLIFKFCSCSS